MTDLELLRRKVDVLTGQVNEIHLDIQETLDELCETMGQVNSMCKFLKGRMFFETVVHMLKERIDDD